MNKQIIPLVLIALLGMAGCGDKQKEPAGQVAVKVGTENITVSALKHELAKLGELSQKQEQQATQEVLNGLVDQTLLKQAAVSDKLDSDADIQMKLEAAKRQILAQAYIEHLTAKEGKPTDAEIQAYFNGHPELFAERHVYQLQELHIEVNESNIQSVQDQLGKTRNLTDFVAWLKGQNIPVRGRQMAKPAEQLPTPLLEKLRKAKLGDSVTSAGVDSLNIIILAGMEKQPVTLDQAKPVIERYLGNSKKKELLDKELQTRRETAKIEYMPPYDAAMNKEAKPAAAEAPAKEKTN